MKTKQDFVKAKTGLGVNNNRTWRQREQDLASAKTVFGFGTIQKSM